MNNDKKTTQVNPNSKRDTNSVKGISQLKPQSTTSSSTSSKKNG